MEKQLVLIDEYDNEIGTVSKSEAHQNGALHRAFSILIFDRYHRLLIQKRAIEKYHSGGMWSNSCCSHPAPGEIIYEAAHLRLKEEMGFDCELHEKYQVLYKLELDRGKIEHEYNHVFVGNYNGAVKPNPEEVEGYQWIYLNILEKEFAVKYQEFSKWFPVILRKYKDIIVN